MGLKDEIVSFLYSDPVRITVVGYNGLKLNDVFVCASADISTVYPDTGRVLPGEMIPSRNGANPGSAFEVDYNGSELSAFVYDNNIILNGDLSSENVIPLVYANKGIGGKADKTPAKIVLDTENNGRIIIEVQPSKGMTERILRNLQASGAGFRLF